MSPVQALYPPIVEPVALVGNRVGLRQPQSHARQYDQFNQQH